MCRVVVGTYDEGGSVVVLDRLCWWVGGAVHVQLVMVDRRWACRDGEASVGGSGGSIVMMGRL